MTSAPIRIGACQIHLVSVIKGLTSEVGKVKEAFEVASPDKVAISISKEELEGLRSMPADFEPELTRYEEIYVDGLRRFGKVSAPPPCYVAALELADHFGIRIVPIDLDEQSYTDLYCATVPGTTLFRHSTRTWLLKRRHIRGDTPEEFVMSWDRMVNKLQGFSTIERKRAETMAKGIVDACEGSKSLLAVVELERADEVRRLLAQSVKQ